MVQGPTQFALQHIPKFSDRATVQSVDICRQPRHMPPKHVALTVPVATHAMPQRPQFSTSASGLTHRPAQRISPAAQGETQAPATHTFVPSQTVPQAPQFKRSICTLLSQPVAAFRSQSRKPARQVLEQAESLQLPIALGKKHDRPQAPQ